MPDAHTHGKPHLKMIERQQAMWRDIKAAQDLLGQAIKAAETEGHRLAQQAAEFEQAELRDESLDPQEVARVVAAEAAIVQRVEIMSAHVARMVQQAEALTQIAEKGLFDECIRQFNAQFNTMKEDL